MRESKRSLTSCSPIATGQSGLSYTRWATHSKPEARNAHPHLDGPGRVAVVQNGIIENYRMLVFSSSATLYGYPKTVPIPEAHRSNLFPYGYASVATA